MKMMLPMGMMTPGLGGGGSSVTYDVAVQGFETGTTTGSPISYPSSPLSGVTPKAALLFTGSHLIATGTAEEPDASIGFGYVAGANQRGFSPYAEDGLGFTNTGNSRSDAHGLLLSDTGGSTTFGRGAVSLVSGGIDINYAATVANRRGVYVAFAGEDVQAVVGTAGMGSSATPVTITPGFEADVVFLSHCATTALNLSHTVHSTFSFGVATKDGSQRCLALNEQDAASSAAPRMALLTNRIGAAMDPASGAQYWTLTAGSFGATSFVITPSGNTGGLATGYLALSLGGGRAKIVDLTTPTATGDQVITGAGFTPRLAIVVLSNLEGVDPTFPVSPTDLTSGMSFSCIGNEQWAHSYRSDAGSDPTDTASFTGNYALIGASATDARAILATLVSFDSDGMTLNYSSVQGTGKKGFILFVE